MTNEERDLKYEKVRYVSSSDNSNNFDGWLIGFSSETYTPRRPFMEGAIETNIRTVAIILSRTGCCFTCGLEKIIFIN